MVLLCSVLMMTNLSSGQEIVPQEKKPEGISELKKENEFLKQQILLLQSTLKEINITDIIKILEEHEKDLVTKLLNLVTDYPRQIA